MARKPANESQVTDSRSLLSAVARVTVYATSLVVLVLVVDWVFRARTLPVDEVRLQGVFEHVSRDDVEARLYAHVTENYLVLDLDAIKRDIELLPWVYRASVRRSWPSGLYISFVEQSLVAQWSANEWLNKYGDVVKFTGSNQPQLDLPLIEAPEGSEKIAYKGYLDFRKILAAQNLDIKKITISDRRSWRMVLSNDMSLLLGRSDISSRLQRFLDVYAGLDKEQSVAIARVDLRYTNGFSLKRVKQSELSLQQTTTESKKLVKG